MADQSTSLAIATQIRPQKIPRPFPIAWPGFLSSGFNSGFNLFFELHNVMFFTQIMYFKIQISLEKSVFWVFRRISNACYD